MATNPRFPRITALRFAATRKRRAATNTDLAVWVWLLAVAATLAGLLLPHDARLVQSPATVAASPQPAQR